MIIFKTGMIEVNKTEVDKIYKLLIDNTLELKEYRKNDYIRIDCDDEILDVLKLNNLISQENYDKSFEVEELTFYNK